MGPTASLPLRRRACWGFFRPKNPTASAGFEPANLGTKGQHATPRPPKPHIQGDSGGICTTLGNDSMSDSKQKSSYEHGFEFEWLRSYGHFLIPVHALMWTALMEPAGGYLHCKHYFCQLTASEWVSGNCNEQLAQFTTERQPVLRPAVTFSKTGFKHRSIQIKGDFTKLPLHLYFKCTMYYAGLLFSSVHCQ